MHLLSRMFKIFRANLHFRWQDRQNDDAFYHWSFGETSSGGATGRPHSHRGTAAIDPVLAGYYANLEVPYGSDLAAVRKAWKRLVSQYHPDLHSNDPDKRRIANELTQGLNRAYEELKKRLEEKP